VLDALLDEAREDDNVVGLIVFGSRGKGAFATETKWLAWELENHPLAWNDLARLERIAHTGDLDEQRTLFHEARVTRAQEHGHGRMIDGWEPDVPWLRGGQ